MKRSREAEDEIDSDYAVSEGHSPVDIRYIEGLPASKIAGLDPAEATQEPHQGVVMRCSLPGHADTLAFSSYDEYQTHYQKSHTNRCLECRGNFPTTHLLSVHIEECHDSFVAVKREKGEHTYSCFVEGCDRKCRTPEKRRLHLIDKHMYPKNYYFAVSRTGTDGRRSLLVDGRERRRSSASNFNSTKESKRRSSLLEATSPQQKTINENGAGNTTKGDTTAAPAAEERTDTDMDDLAGAMSALKFIPHSVKFGRGGGKAGFSKR